MSPAGKFLVRCAGKVEAGQTRGITRLRGRSTRGGGSNSRVRTPKTDVGVRPLFRVRVR